MKYLVVGAGGTGGPLAAYLAQGGQDVDVIARGVHGRAIVRQGLRLIRPQGESIVPLSVYEAETYQGRPDVVFVCVKGYGLEGAIPLLERVCGEKTIVIPILNIYGTGARLQALLPRSLVTDGCIYISGEITQPGTILLTGTIFRIVFGVRRQDEYRPELELIQQELCRAGIDGVLSEDIQRDAMVKFTYVSAMAACGLLHDVKAGEMQAAGPVREDMAALIGEVQAVAQAMDIVFAEDMVARNLSILDMLAPGASTSLKRDVDADKDSELDGLIFQVVRLGRHYGVETPMYRRVALAYGFSQEGEGA